MRKENSAIRTKFISEAGTQLINADYFAFVELDNYACYCIADGIDNDKEKESAKLAVSTVIDQFLQKPGMGKGIMKGYLEKVHQTLLRESGTLRLEASVLVVITDYKKVRYANAGNVRLYHWRNGRVINQSKDMSLSQNMAERGDIALDKIEEHEERHNLYCYAGQRGKFKPYVSPKTKMVDGDIISLMTCGVWENTGVAELLDAIEDSKAPDEVCAIMEELILSQRLRNIPNYTFTCIYIDKVYLNPNRSQHQKIIKRVLIPIIILLITLLIAFIVSLVSMHNKISSMWNNIELAVQDMAAGIDGEGNNNYEKAKDIYEDFDSKRELSNKRVIQAKYYLNLLNYREDYLNGATCYDRYVAACKIMVCLVGRGGYERLENDGVDDKVLAISSLQQIDYEYMDRAAREDLENFKESFAIEYENVKLEYEIYKMLEETKVLFEDEINNSSNERNLVKRAKRDSILIYNFEDTDFKDAYLELNSSVTIAVNGNVNLHTTLTEYEEFLKLVSSKLAYIKGKAYDGEGDSYVYNSDLKNAKVAYENALEFMKKAGEDAYAGEIRDIETKLASLEQEISDQEASANNGQAMDLLKEAITALEKKKYDKAEEKCNEVAVLLTEAGISSGVVYDDLTKLQERIEAAKEGESYEKEAATYEAQGDYSMAYSTYEYAQKAYKEAGVSDKEREMRQKMNQLKGMLNQ